MTDDGKPRKMGLQRRVRAALRENMDGLSVPALELLVQSTRWGVNEALRAMPDAYIDRWERVPTTRGLRYRAVWCVVIPPEHCPKPEKPR